jgi:hypothetical protein
MFTKKFSLPKMNSNNLSLWRFIGLVHGVFGMKRMTTYSRAKRQVLQYGDHLRRINALLLFIF